MSDEQITLSEVEWSRAWNVRGDAAQPTFKLEAERLLGVALPLRSNASARSNATAHDGGTLALWSRPGSWLVMAGTDAVQMDFDAARVALNAAGGALFDVSASYVAWKISGVNAARESLPVEDHRRRNNRASERRAAGLVDSGNRIGMHLFKLEAGPRHDPLRVA